MGQYGKYHVESDELYRIVRERLKQGANAGDIEKTLIIIGMSKKDASGYVRDIHSSLKKSGEFSNEDTYTAIMLIIILLLIGSILLVLCGIACFEV